MIIWPDPEADRRARELAGRQAVEDHENPPVAVLVTPFPSSSGGGPKHPPQFYVDARSDTPIGFVVLQVRGRLPASLDPRAAAVVTAAGGRELRLEDTAPVATLLSGPRRGLLCLRVLMPEAETSRGRVETGRGGRRGFGWFRLGWGKRKGMETEAETETAGSAKPSPRARDVLEGFSR